MAGRGGGGSITTLAQSIGAAARFAPEKDLDCELVMLHVTLFDCYVAEVTTSTHYVTT